MLRLSIIEYHLGLNTILKHRKRTKDCDGSRGGHGNLRALCSHPPLKGLNLRTLLQKLCFVVCSLVIRCPCNLDLSPIRWLWCANDKASGEKENLTWERVLRTLVRFLGASGATGSTRRVAHEKWIYRNIWSR